MAREPNDRPRTPVEIAARIDQARQLSTSADLTIMKALHDLRMSRIMLAEAVEDLLRGAS